MCLCTPEADTIFRTFMVSPALGGSLLILVASSLGARDNAVLHKSGYSPTSTQASLCTRCLSRFLCRAFSFLCCFVRCSCASCWPTAANRIFVAHRHAWSTVGSSPCMLCLCCRNHTANISAVRVASFCSVLEGTKSELATSSLPSRGPTSGQKCYVTPTFSGVPKRGDKIRIGSLTLAFSGA